MSALGKLLDGMLRNNAFLVTVPEAASPPGTEEVSAYIRWLVRQRRALDAAPTSIAARDLVAFSLADNEAFRDHLAELAPEAASRLSPLLAPDTVGAIADADMDLLFRHYSGWVMSTLTLCDTVFRVEHLRLDLRDEQRDALQAKLDQARGKLGEATDRAVDYQQAKHDKKDLKKAVAKFLGRDGLLDNPSTSKLIRELEHSEVKLQGEISRAGFDSVRGQELRDQLEQVRLWLTELPKVRMDKVAGRIQAKDASHEAKVITRQVDAEISGEKKRFKKAHDKVAKGVVTEQAALETEIDATCLALAELHQKTDALVDEIADLDGLVTRLEKRPPSADGNLALAHLRQAREEGREKLARLNARERELTASNTELSFRLGAITDVVADALHGQAAVEKQRIAMRDELARLRRLPKLEKAVNVYCTFYEVCFPLILRLGALAGDLQSGFHDLNPYAKPAATVFSEQERIKLLIYTKMLKMAGLPKGVVSAKGWHTGELRLSLKLGVSFGQDAGIFVAKAGLAIVYEAVLKVRDDRRFEAQSTLKLVAEARVKGTTDIAGLAPKMEVLNAFLAVDLVTQTTVFIFSDHFHWAAWVCQKWAQCCAKIAAFSSVCGDNDWSQPTPGDLQAMRLAAAGVFRNQPHLVSVMNDIAWFLEEDVERREELSGPSGVRGGARAMNRLAGADAGAEMAWLVRRYRMKRDKQGDLVIDPHTGLPVEQWKSTLRGHLHASFSTVLSKIELYLSTGEEGNDLTVLKVRLWLKPKKAVGWVLDNVQAVIDAENAVTDALEEALAPVGDTVSDALAGQILSSVEKAVQMLLMINIKSEWGFHRVHDRWNLVYVRKLAMAMDNEANAREVAIPTGLPGLNVDLGIDYQLSRFTSEKFLGGGAKGPTGALMKHDGTMAYLKSVYAGLMRRRQLPPGHDGHTYATRIAPLWLLGASIGTMTGEGAKVGGDKMMTFDASAGRPPYASGPGLWKGIVDDMKPLFGLYLSLAVEAHKSATRDPSKPEKVSTIRAELLADGAEASKFLRACEELLVEFKTIADKDGKPRSLPAVADESTKEDMKKWKSAVKNQFTPEGFFRHDGRYWTKTSKATGNAVPYTHAARPLALYHKISEALTAYLEATRRQTMAADDAGWQDILPAKGLEALATMEKAFHTGRHSDYLGYLEQIRQLHEATGYSRETIEKGIKKAGSLDAARQELEAKHQKQVAQQEKDLAKAQAAAQKKHEKEAAKSSAPKKSRWGF